MLAVAAAFITVNEMKRSDQEQPRRHTEQMEHARRPERLARERIVQIYPTCFNHLAIEAQEVADLIMESMGRPDIDRPLVKTVANFLVFLHQAVGDDAIRQARPFFDGAIEMNFNFLVLKDDQFRKADYREFLKPIAISVIDGTRSIPRERLLLRTVPRSSG